MGHRFAGSAWRHNGGELCGYAKVVRDRMRDKQAEGGAWPATPCSWPVVHDSVIVTDLEGMVTYWNDGATRLFGWTAAEMRGRPIADRVPPEARPAMAERMAKLRAGDDFAGEWEDYRKDGSRVWIEARATLSRDRTGRPIGYLGLAHDVTERKKVEDALRQSEERFRELFENAADAVYTVDLQGHFTSANAASERLTGYSVDELLRMKVPDLMTPEQLERSVKMLEAKLTGGNRTVYDLELLTKDGQAPVRANQQPAHRPRRPTRRRARHRRDLTEQKRSDEIVRASEQRFPRHNGAQLGRGWSACCRRHRPGTPAPPRRACWALRRQR